MVKKLKQLLNPKRVKPNSSQTQKGQSLVEMAITAPILIFLLIGVFEVGWAIRSYVVLVNVNREITRFAVRPGYLDFSDQTTVDTSYAKVRNWVDTSLTEQLDMDFDETDGNATLIVSHLIADTGYPCDPDDPVENCQCNKFDPNDAAYDPNYGFTLDDRIYSPDQSDQTYQAQRFGPASTSTGSRDTRLKYAQIVQELAAQNNVFNCEILKKGGIPSANNAIFTELFLDQPQLFGFPFISNPFTDPVPLYTHTSMRLTCGARSTGSSDNNLSCGVDNVGPACEAYPITFPESTFDDPDHPTVPQDIDAYEGDSPGNWGWITWNPDNSNNNENYVEKELKYPQMSRTDFTDVCDNTDNLLNINDCVSTKPGVASSSDIDEQLKLLVGKTILVPVFDNNPGSGAGAYYHITHFALIRVDEICLPGHGNKCDAENKKEINATFLGYADELCGIDGAVGGNHPPVANDDTYSTDKDTAIILNILSNDTDSDGDTLTLMTYTSPAKGTLTDNGDGTLTYTPKNNTTGVGTFTFDYTVSDGLSSDTGTVTLIVTAAPNQAPAAAADSYSAYEDTPLTVAASGLLGNDTDPESNPLTAIKVSDPANGTLALNADGSFTYTPNAGFTGTDSFTYLARDTAAADSNVATVTITVDPAPNHAPVAAHDSYITNQDTALNVPAAGVLSNDTDSDGDSLTAIQVTSPAHGTLTFNTNGSFVYTPTSGYFGSDSFTYKANDGTVDSATATVTITVNKANTPPVADDDTATTTRNTAVLIDVGSNDSDADGDTLTYSLSATPGHGTLVYNGSGQYTYTPASGYTGPDSFTYSVSDGKGGSDTATVAITVQLPAPTTIAADNFESGGSSGWSGNWNYGGGSDVVTNDSPHSPNHHLRSRGTEWAYREVNMSDVTDAHLLFWWKARSLESGDNAYVRIYYNGSWHTIFTVNNGDDDDTYHFADITLPASAMTSDFRIGVQGDMSSSSDYFYIDDIEITGIK